MTDEFKVVRPDDPVAQETKGGNELSGLGISTTDTVALSTACAVSVFITVAATLGGGPVPAGLCDSIAFAMCFATCFAMVYDEVRCSALPARALRRGYSR